MEKFVSVKAISGEDAGEALFEAYECHTTPTVLIAESNGSEIDRIIGFQPPGEKFKDDLEKLITNEESFKNLSSIYEKDPKNLKNAIKLLRKYQDNVNYDKMVEVNKGLLDSPKKLKKMEVPYGKDDAKVTAYEYSHCIEILSDYNKAVPFIDEFQNSAMLDNVFKIMSRHLYRAENKEEVYAVYNKLFKMFPNDYNLVYPYIRFSVGKETNAERAAQIAGAYYNANKDDMNSRMLNMYASLLLAIGKDDEAMKVYGAEYAAKVIEDEKKASELNAYSWFWAGKGKNLESALKAAEISLKLKDDANTWDTLSMVYWKMGDHEQALKAEKTALEMVGGENKGFEKRIKEITEDMNKNTNE